MNTVKRTPNFSIKEKHLLLGVVAKYKEIIENKGTSTSISNRKTDAWKRITADFNSEVEVVRPTKHLRLLYSNLKRKTKKDIAEDYKEAYLEANITAEEDKKEINKTGGGRYEPQLDDTGAQILAIIGEQVQPLSNLFDDAADYFHDIPFGFETEPQLQPGPEPELQPGPQPELQPESQPEPQPQPHSEPESQLAHKISKKRGKTTKKKQIEYKQLYFQKKYQLACFELKLKNILHNLENQIKKKQLQNLSTC